jgi:cytochrome c-type biogenesis protein CcmE
MSKRTVILLMAIVGFGALGLMQFKQTVTPYVSFAEAKSMERTVQVAGFPDHAGSGLNAAHSAFTFTMKDDEGDQMVVNYPGGKPGNFDQAQSVVVVGRYEDGAMEAKQILVKCPSKYESQGDEHPGGEALDATS